MIRLLLIVLAMACQIGSAAAGQAAADPQSAELAAVAIFCQGAPHTADGHAPQPRRHVPDQAIFDAAPMHGHAAIAPGLAPCLPAPASGPIGQATTPATRAPPGLYAASSLPRGPPPHV